MKLVCACVCVFGAQLMPAPAAAQEVLDNAAIVQMVTAKVPKDLIMAKITTTPAMFDVTPAGLVSLNMNKVAKDIMESMMTASQDANLSRNRATEVLTNQGVIQMVTGKLPSSTIQKKIKTTPSAFDLTAGGLISLNENKVPQDLVKLMMTSATMTPASAQPVRSDPRPMPVSAPLPTGPRPHVARAVLGLTKIPKEPGIYMYNSGGTGLVLEALEPTGYSTSGNRRAGVRGAESAIRTSDGNPEFYFVFGTKPATANPAFKGATNANEFALIALTVKDGAREAVAGEKPEQGGANGNADVPFMSVRLAPGIYRVTPKYVLGEGEYAFMSEGTGSGGNKIFDFAVVK